MQDNINYFNARNIEAEFYAQSTLPYYFKNRDENFML